VEGARETGDEAGVVDALEVGSSEVVIVLVITQHEVAPPPTRPE